MKSTKPGCFRSSSWSLWNALEEEGASAWFHDVWTWFLWKALKEESASAWFHDVWTCSVEVIAY